MFLLKYVNLEVSLEGLKQDVAECLPSAPLQGHEGIKEKLEEWFAELEDAGIEVRWASGADLDATLWITEFPERAKERMNQGKPVMGLLCGNDQKFEGIPFLGYHLVEMDAVYLERVYRRQKGLPWEILETERCLVRETVPSDAKAFYEIYADPSVTRFMEDLPKDEAEFGAWLSEYKKHVYGFLNYGIWTVCRKAQDMDAGDGDMAEVVIGRAGLTVREGFEDPELGFVIGKNWQGMGYAKEVCDAILSYARDLGIRRILAFAEEENEPSKHLLQKLGFARVGELDIDGRHCLQFVAEFYDGE